MSQSPPDTLGKYQIIREIARSNDIVYEGYDPVMNRRVAVKELAVPSGSTPQQKEDRIKRFMREAKAAGSLVHPNIVTVYDVAEQNGRYYLAMEFLDGQTLRKTIEEKSTIPTDDALNITIEIAKALSFAHANGVVHRDVKPENIQILANGAVKLTDFGIARLTFEPNITMDGQVFGTPSYMSPEQINGREIDARSDIFSLGIILYEMLAGKKPFTGDSVVSITYAIMNAEPTPLPGINHQIWSIISKSLDKTPQLRHNSTDQLIAELKDASKSIHSVVLDPTPPHSASNYNQVLNSPYTPYGTPNPLYNPNLAAINQAGQAVPPPPTTPPQSQYNYNQPAGTTNYAPYQPGGAPPPQPMPSHYPAAYAPMYGGSSATQGPSQIPVYYPPPPRRKVITISPEATANLSRFIMAFLIIGGICGLLVFGLNAITSASSSANRSATLPPPAIPTSTDSSAPPPRAEPQPTSAPATEPKPNLNVSNQPTGNPETLMLDAETLIDQGALNEIARIRKELWRDANEKVRDAIIIAPSQETAYKSRATTRYQEVARNLANSGNRTAARDALYQALSLSPDDNARADISARLTELGG